ELSKLRKMLGDQRLRFRIGNTRKELYRAFGDLVASQFLQMTNEDHWADRAHELGDPEPHIGRPCHNPRFRISSINRRKVIKAGRNENLVRPLAELDPPPVIERLDLPSHRNPLRPQRVTLRRAMIG